MDPGGKVYGLWLNQKGKVLADSYILRRGPEDYLVFAPRVSPGVLRERLEAYLIADEVTIDDITSHWSSIWLWGEQKLLRTQLETLNIGGALRQDEFVEVDGALVWTAREPQEGGYLLLCPSTDQVRWSERLAQAGLTTASWDDFERARLTAGVPVVPEDIGPADLPNEGKLEQVAISYTKGCYLGQKVMSRLKNLGQVRRKLHRVRGPGEPPAYGTAVFQGGQRVGEFRSAARDRDGFVAFAMLSLVSLKPDIALSRSADGAADIALAHG